MYRKSSVLFLAVLAVSWATPSWSDTAFVSTLNQISIMGSMVATNGDQNPYGVARVPVTKGKLKEGSMLVSDFNNSLNLQGTGSTITQIGADGTATPFAQINAANLPGSCPGGVGLTTALTVLHSGWVVAGSLPTTDGTAATAQAGCLLVLDSQGQVVETFAGGDINGPWDLTAVEDQGTVALFVTNVLNGTVAAGGSTVNQGTVLRLRLRATPQQAPVLMDSTIIGVGFGEKTDVGALVIGPTGVTYDSQTNALYVADTLGNQITAIANPLRRNDSAGIGLVISAAGSLNSPLGLTSLPNGDLIAVNGGDGNAVEITRSGQQVATLQLSSAGPGALFGVWADPGGKLFFVDDSSNMFMLATKA